MRDNGIFIYGVVVEITAQQIKMQSLLQTLNNAISAFSHCIFACTFLEIKTLFVCLCQHK